MTLATTSPPSKFVPAIESRCALPEHKLPHIRFIQFSEDGKTLFISDNDRTDGCIYALRDPDENGVFQTVTTFVKNKRSVQGMCMHDGWLYFSQALEGSVSRVKEDGSGDVEVVLPPKSLPTDGGHPYEGILVTDKEIYVTASDPQNFTEQIDTDRKKIYVFDLDGSNKRVFCTGIRNTEKLRSARARPKSGASIMARTILENSTAKPPARISRSRDLNPPEEFNHYVQDAFYGHPFIMGNGVPRPEFEKRPDIIQLADKTTEPDWLVHVHWAVLGYAFITSDYFAGQKGDCWFCSHGSWNSVHPVGAVVQRLMFDDVTGKPFGSQTIVDCYDGNRRWARPVDAAGGRDGTVIFSSDEPPSLYRISKSAK